MQPTVTLDRTLVAVHVDGVVHLMLELAAPDAEPAARPPIDVVVVLDRSDSMAGQPLQAVREATCNLLRLLGPTDRLGVVAFDDAARMVLPLAGHGVDAASDRIRGIESGGMTNLSGGLLKGLEMLAADRRSDALRRVIVLTDGHANVGITDSGHLSWLAQAALEQGVTTSTIGFADGYDEVLLASIADAGSGNDYWCAGPDQAPQVFAAEFEGLATVVAQNTSVELRPRAGIQVAVLNEHPITQVDGGLQVALGDAYGGERRRVVAAYWLGQPDQLGVMDLGEIVIRWASTVGDVALHTTTIPVTVNVTDDPDLADVALNPAVVEQVTVLRAAHERKTAHERLSRGDIAGARRAMKSTIKLLSTVDGAPLDLVQAQRDLDELDQGAWSAASTKRLFALTRSATKGRRSRFDDTDPDTGPAAS